MEDADETVAELSDCGVVGDAAASEIVSREESASGLSRPD